MFYLSRLNWFLHVRCFIGRYSALKTTCSSKRVFTLSDIWKFHCAQAWTKTCNFVSKVLFPFSWRLATGNSLRKQPRFCDATNGFPRNDAWMSLPRSGYCFDLERLTHIFNQSAVGDDNWQLMDDNWLLHRYCIDKCVTCDYAHQSEGPADVTQLTWCNTVFTLSNKILTHRSLWCIDCWRVLLVPST